MFSTVCLFSVSGGVPLNELCTKNTAEKVGLLFCLNSNTDTLDHGCTNAWWPERINVVWWRLIQLRLLLLLLRKFPPYIQLRASIHRTEHVRYRGASHVTRKVPPMACKALLVTILVPRIWRRILAFRLFFPMNG